MRGGNQTNPLALVVAACGLIAVGMGVIAALPYLPGAIGTFLQHIQNPTNETFVMSVKYIVALVIAFAIPTSIFGIFVTLIGELDV